MTVSAECSPKKCFIGAVKDDWQMFSDDRHDYTLGLPIGFGASSIVYAARYQPKGCTSSIPCALKVLDLDTLPPRSLHLLMRETQLMSLSKHPNVLRVRGSWMDGHKLYIASRLMNSGSAADVMRYGWPGGMEEDVVKCIMKQALEGLNYLHINGFIHRDVKAANLFIDDDGTVLLGDLGVAASLSDEDALSSPPGTKRTINFVSSVDPPRTTAPRTNKIGKRKSFVGTPCWMAPELISGKQYDSKVDIWSFGITALELTQGRAPRSKEPSAKVLLKTVQEDPPPFQRDSGQHKYTKAFKDVVESCLIKDPAQRPTAAQLLETSFFKSAKKKSFLVGAVLKDLPPLVKRQERRRQPSTPSTRTCDSWDFSSSIPASPITSVHYRRPLSFSRVDESVFDLEHIAEPGEADVQELRADEVRDIEEQETVSFKPEFSAGEFEASSDSATPSLSLSQPSTPVTPLSRSPLTVTNSMETPFTSHSSIAAHSDAPISRSSDSRNSEHSTGSPSSKSGVWKKLIKSSKGVDEKEKGKQKALVGRLWDRTVGIVEEVKSASPERKNNRNNVAQN